MGNRARLLTALVLAFVVGTSSGALAGHKGDTYSPPYRKGHQGGDFANLISADRQSGRVSVFRVYPFPGAFSCGSEGGFATLRVVHRVTRPVRAVVVRYTDAMVDAYTWITLVARDGNENWLGSKAVRGPLFGTGRVRVSLGDRSPGKGEAVVAEFGLQVASACPNVDGGTARFTAVAIRDA